MKASVVAVALSLAACGSGGPSTPPTNPQAGPAAGNPDGHATIPAER
jgi:hypothetical protein